MTLPLGEVSYTMEALFAFAAVLDEEPSKFLDRHASGDSGKCQRVRHRIAIRMMKALRGRQEERLERWSDLIRQRN